MSLIKDDGVNVLFNPDKRHNASILVFTHYALFALESWSLLPISQWVGLSCNTYKLLSTYPWYYVELFDNYLWMSAAWICNGIGLSWIKHYNTCYAKNDHDILLATFSSSLQTYFSVSLSSIKLSVCVTTFLFSLGGYCIWFKKDDFDDVDEKDGDYYLSKAWTAALQSPSSSNANVRRTAFPTTLLQYLSWLWYSAAIAQSTRSMCAQFSDVLSSCAIEYDTASYTLPYSTTRFELIMWFAQYYVFWCHGRISSQTFTCNGLISGLRFVVKVVYASYGSAKNNKPDGSPSISLFDIVDVDVLCCSCAFAAWKVRWACFVQTCSSLRYCTVSLRWAYVRAMYSHTRWNANILIA